MPKQDGSSNEQGRRRDVRTHLRDWITTRRTIADEVISLVNLLGRPIADVDGNRVGRVNDVAVHWSPGSSHPRVSGVLISMSRGVAFLDASELTLEQAKVRVRSSRIAVAKPVRDEGDIALARDVLDRQLVDIEGVQVVRAADVYLRRLSDGWELAGVEVEFWAYARRLLHKRRSCPSPRRVIDWTDLQSFVPRSGGAAPRSTGPAAAAGDVGGGLQLGSPAKELRRLHSKEVAAIIVDLGRNEQAHIASLATPSVAAEALLELSQKQRDAVLAELSESDRNRLLELLEGGDRR